MEEMPKLTKCTLLTAFKCVESVRMKNAGRLEEMEVLVNAKKEVEEEMVVEKEAKKSVLAPLSKNDWDRMDERIEAIGIGSKSCNENGFGVLDLSGFVNLREFKVGDECFKYVSELKCVGMRSLELFFIGVNSFTTKMNGYGMDPNRHFYLKNCPKLKSLKIGRYSFSDYTVCEIENVDALEVIEMSYINFAYASLELKSIVIHSE